MILITQGELGDIHRRLHDPTWRFRLQRLQDIVYREFRKIQDQNSTLTIRTIVPRGGLKGYESVVRKIRDHRARGQARYAFEDIDDFVGIKILCPYPSDVQKVIARMKGHPGFRVTPEDARAARHEKPHGYRGYHYRVALRRPLLEGNEDLAQLPCEVQVKTMLEEAWDAKTHDLSYKREEDINPDLLARMRVLSDALTELDLQSELVKTQIQLGALADPRSRSAGNGVSNGRSAAWARKNGRVSSPRGTRAD